MPYKDPEKQKEQRARYYRENREKEKGRQARYYRENREREKERAARYRQKNREKVNESYIRYRQRGKERAIELLGGKCVCCGSTDDLTFDHIKPVRRGGKRRGSWSNTSRALQNPHLFQLLCSPCNNRKNDGPACPCHFWDTIDPDWRKR